MSVFWLTLVLPIREGTFFIGGVGRGILEIFGEKSRGPPTYQIGLMHDPSQTPTQKHLTLPHLLREKNNWK